MAYLVVKDIGGTEVCRVELNVPKIIGRSHQCDVMLAGAHVSRRHLRFERVNDRFDQWAAIDLDSKHGSFVNGQRITRQILKDGDSLEFGDFVARFHEGAPIPRRFENPHDALFAGSLVEEPPLAPKRPIEAFPAPKPQQPTVGKDDPLYCSPVEVRPEDF